ncbi:MAG: ABC transporter ATP-binding protein [Candidatus Eremiobacterota bacterium]
MNNTTENSHKICQKCGEKIDTYPCTFCGYKEEKKIKLQVNSLCQRFITYSGEEVRAMENLSLDMYDGEFLTLVGPSGCGKSTFLRIVAGLDRPVSGTITLDCKPVTGPGQDRGMVFQKYTSFPWLTVGENVALPLHIADRLMPFLISRHKPVYSLFYALWPSFRKREDEIKAKVMEHLTDVGLEKFINVFPGSLSGGMQQRVAIARTIASGPSILLMDEPFGALDAQTRVQMQELLLEVCHKGKCTVMFVTHDIEESIYLADRVIVFSARPTHVKEIIEVPFKRPRSQDIKTTPEFEEIEVKIMRSIKDEYKKM